MLELLTEVKKIVVEQFGVGMEEINGTTSIVDDLGADSLDNVELMMNLEEKFSLSIPDEEAVKISTVKDIVNYISKNKSTNKIVSL